MKLMKNKINCWQNTKIAASEEKITILEQDIDLLWQKVCVYEKYSAEERNLRVKAREAFRKHEIRMFGSVKDYDKKIFKEEPRQSRWQRPKIKMTRQGNQAVEEA